LSLHGFVELKPAERLTRQRLAERLQPEVDRMLELVYRDQALPSGWYVEMSGPIHRGQSNDLWGLAKDHLSMPEDQRDAAIGKLGEIAKDVAGKIDPGADCRPGSFRGGHDFIEFFRADWFEMLIFLECRRRIGKARNAEVLLKVEFQSSPTMSGSAALSEGEFDVGIAANNQLHCIECKAYRATGGKKSRQHLDHFRRVKEELVGPGGIALLVSARPTDVSSAMARTAELGHLEFAAGWNEIDAALGRIVQRCG
jgi:hypothetical protein